MNSPKDAILESVNDLLNEFSIIAPPVPVEDITRRLGIIIARQPFKGSQSGFALRDGATQVIGVNSSTSRKRQRFTIAHELGHLKLHQGKLIVDYAVRVNWRDESSSHGTIQDEIQANAFAAQLLMPEAFVEEQLHLTSPEDAERDALTSRLAQIFDVSMEAMAYRLTNLGVFA